MFDFSIAHDYYNRLPEDFDDWCAIDTESTGLHHRHGARPFMVAVTFGSGETHLWQARVNPATRRPRWLAWQKKEIAKILRRPRIRYVMSNKKFDVRMLRLIDKRIIRPKWFLARCDETVCMHHILNNLEDHSLKSAAIKHASIPDSDESDLHAATRVATAMVANLGWRLASKTTCHIRRAPAKGWAVMDMWLCREVAYWQWERSEAYKFLMITKGSDGPCTLCGGPHWSADCIYKAPKEWSNKLIKQAMQLPGWDWHPPEIHPTWRTIKKGISHEDKIAASFGNRPDLTENVPDPSYGVSHPWYDLCGVYCRYDTLRSVILAKVFTDRLVQDGLYHIYLEHNINGLMSYIMEENGVSFLHHRAKDDLAVYEKAASNAEKAAQFSLSKIFKVSLTSPKQLQSQLYGKSGFGLPVERYTVNKKNRDAEGQPVTDKDIFTDWIGRTQLELPQWQDLNPPRFEPEMGEKFTDYLKKLGKWHDLLNSQPDPMMAKLFSFCCGTLMYRNNNESIKQIKGFLFHMLDVTEDGYATLYQSINPNGTKTTRQSHSNPNGANISKGGKVKKILEFLFRDKKTLRNLFGPRPGREWWDCDYSQLQLVIFAFMAHDEGMIEAIMAGRDLHDLTARRIFGLPLDPSDPQYLLQCPTDDQRLIAKGVNFGFLFGAQEAKLNRVGGVAGFYDILCNTMPSVVGFLDKKEWEVRTRGYVQTMGGYRLYVPEATPYAGSVYAIQGTEGEIVKRASYGVQYYLDRQVRVHRNFYPTLAVHDALTFDSKLGYGQRYIGSVVSIMEDAATSFGVRAKVGCKYISEDWSCGIEQKEE